jgi:hypothetical protein
MNCFVHCWVSDNTSRIVKQLQDGNVEDLMVTRTKQSGVIFNTWTVKLKESVFNMEQANSSKTDSLQLHDYDVMVYDKQSWCLKPDQTEYNEWEKDCNCITCDCATILNRKWKTQSIWQDYIHNWQEEWNYLDWIEWGMNWGMKNTTVIRLSHSMKTAKQRRSKSLDNQVISDFWVHLPSARLRKLKKR